MQALSGLMARRVPRELAPDFRPITTCADDPVLFALDWFTHPSAPHFTICSRCFVDFIHSSQFGQEFQITHRLSGKPQRCLFGVPRVKSSLWPQALASGTLAHLLQYMQTRQGLPFCSERVAVTDQAWYVPADNPNLMCFCPACYEDKIQSGPFGGYFRRDVRKEAGICDHTTWYIRRQLETGRDWNAFVREVAARNNVPACPQAELMTGPERLWFTSSLAPAGFKICEACYWDYFRASVDDWTFSAQRLGVGETTICLMSQSNFLIPIIRAITLADPQVFWKAAIEVSQNALCNPRGMNRAMWYTLPSNPDEFDVCGACMAGIVKPMGMADHFVPKTSVGPHDTMLCCFNIQGFWRAGLFLEKLAEGAYLNTWQPLSDLAIKLAHAPICPKVDRQKAVQNQKWWGWSYANICEECYNVSIRGSLFESHFELRGQNIGEPRICDMFSARMRERYHNACHENNLQGFLQFAQSRRQVYLQTMPECDRLLAAAKFALGQAQTLGLAAVSFSAAGNLKDTTWGHDYTVGNSVVGHGYANEELLNAAMTDHKMQTVSAAAAGPAAIARVGMLEQRWKSVE